MRYWSIILIIIFGTSYLLLRFILSLSKGSSDKFFAKAIKSLANQTLLFFICVSILLTLYTFGALDSVHINWEYLIDAIAVFGVAWILFCIFVIFFCLLVVKKWNELEVNARDFSINIY